LAKTPNPNEKYLEVGLPNPDIKVLAGAQRAHEAQLCTFMGELAVKFVQGPEFFGFDVRLFKPPTTFCRF
jgi:hypothetical protein